MRAWAATYSEQYFTQFVFDKFSNLLGCNALCYALLCMLEPSCYNIFRNVAFCFHSQGSY